jgi:hypothetical protein
MPHFGALFKNQQGKPCSIIEFFIAMGDFLE